MCCSPKFDLEINNLNLLQEALSILNLTWLLFMAV